MNASAPSGLPHRAARLVRLVYRKLIYRRHLLHRYEVAAVASIPPKRPLEFELDFISDPARFGEVLGTNPYLTGDDIARFAHQRSTCIVVADGQGRILASSWMTSGDVAVHELARTVAVPPNEHFSCRSFVSEDSRGLSLLSHMIHGYAERLPSTDVVWGLVYPWNKPSVDSLERIGWQRTGEYWTSWTLGVKRSGQRYIGVVGSERTTPA